MFYGLILFTGVLLGGIMVVILVAGAFMSAGRNIRHGRR